MVKKIAVFVPPYLLSTEEKYKDNPKRDATLMRKLIAEAEAKGYEIIELNHPEELGNARELKARKESLIKELEKHDIKGAEVVLVGHSLGAFLVKGSLGKISEMIGGKFTAISIAGRHSGEMVAEKREGLLRYLQNGWEKEHGTFERLSDKPEVPKGCKLIEVFSPKDPILRSRSRLKRMSMGLGNVIKRNRVPVRLKNVDPNVEGFITHHLFRGHEAHAAKCIMRHF